MMCLATGVVRADWLQFRGPNATAVSTEAKVPGDDLKISWSADLPGRGLSAPIVVGDRVFVTCSSGPGQETLQVGKEDVAIDDIVPVGHYAVKLVFSDGHDSGLYSWNVLYELGRDYAANWQDYLARLAAAGHARRAG